MKRLLAVLLVAGVATFSLSAGGPPTTSPDLPSASSSAMVDVIVQFNLPATTSSLGSVKMFGSVNKQFSSFQGVRMQLPANIIPLLSKLPFIKYISPNRPNKAHLDISTAAVNANLVWSYGYTGSGVGVAVIDSGVTPVSDLGSRVVYSQNMISTGATGTTDAYGHGTHVAGIIGASGAASQVAGSTRDYKGVAPNANIINLRVLDQNGSGVDSDVIAAIEQAIALKNTYNIRVINLSLGRPVYESFTLDPLCQAVEAAWRAGIVVVVAAGNDGRDNTYGENGYGTIEAPGNDPYVITVGATNTAGTATIADDTVASYSSKGPTLIDHIVKPDLVAPGNNVVSLLASPNCTLATLYPTSTLIPMSTYVPGATGNSTSYYMLSGTSMATPIVSGAAALLIQANPSITPDQIKARLMKTARKALPSYMSAFDKIFHIQYTFQGDIFTVGAGYVDIFGALQDSDATPTGVAAVSPAVQYKASTGQVNLVRQLSIIWGSSIIWGDSIIWGNSIIWGDSIIWGSSVLAGGVNGSSIIWGNSVIWGTSTVAGFSIIWGNSVNLAITPTASSANDGDQ